VTLLLPLIAFVLASALVGVAALRFIPKSAGAIDRRLGEVTGTLEASAFDTSADVRRVATDTFKRLANVAPRSSASERGKLQTRLINAGYRNPEALIVFAGIRVAMALFGFAVVGTPILMRPNIMMALVLCCFGYMFPTIVLARVAKRRQHRIQLSLPDALDLLVVSVEAGLGIDQALQRVGHELVYAHPELCEELRLVNLELRAGKTRSEALTNLAERTGVDDVVSLAAMLVQTDKFGTSVAQSLRVHSESLRTKRRQRAEEAAAKTGVKMVFPLVICIFPAVWVVTIGPAAIKFIQVLGPIADGVGK
jgi:tight adherence protein C